MKYYFNIRDVACTRIAQALGLKKLKEKTYARKIVIKSLKYLVLE